MGTTLTGTTPANTYDSLIKVTDNGPLSGTAKYLSDGLGNDSALALSTSNIGIGTNNPTSVLDVVSSGTGVAEFEGPANATVNFKGVGYVEGLIRCGGEFTIGSTNNFPISFLTNNSEKMRITSAGNVGIGTSNPTELLQVEGNLKLAGIINVTGGDASIWVPNVGQALTIKANTGNVGIGTSSPQQKLHIYTGANGGLQQWEGLGYTTFLGQDGTGSYLYQNSSGRNFSIGSNSSRSQLVLDGGGNVGIGTASPNRELTVNGQIEATDIVLSGAAYLGGTASANALDDYEEGTFTATITPSTSGTITSNASFTTWSYTKIGRQVTINGAFVISSVSSPVGALVNVGGLPFAVRNSLDSFGAVSAGYADASASYAKSPLWAVHGTNTTTLNLGIDASTVAASDEFYITATYFV